MTAITLGQLPVGIALVDFLIGSLFGLSMARRQAELPVERRSAGPYIIMGAAAVAGTALVTLAINLPEAQLTLI